MYLAAVGSLAVSLGWLLGVIPGRGVAHGMSFIWTRSVPFPSLSLSSVTMEAVKRCLWGSSQTAIVLQVTFPYNLRDYPLSSGTLGLTLER
jgi:hypothetical protein